MKRFFMTLMVLIFAVPSNFPVAAFAQDSTATPFPDVYSDDEYINDIWYLKDNNIVQGYEITTADGTKLENQFRSDYEINRAELTKIMIEAQFSDEEINQCVGVYFPDVNSTDWFAKYVCMAKEKGIIAGYPDGTFKPGEPVNFAEAAKIIANALDLSVTADASVDWYVPFVRAMVARKGAPESIRSFGKLLTRGEMARMIHAGKELLSVPTLTVATLTELDAKEPELPQVDTCNVLLDQLSTAQEAENKMYGPPSAADGFGEETAAPATPSPESGSGGATNQTADRDQAYADDFSQTNTQVKGVDEADIIKNDGKYIYLIKGNTVRIVSAYPGNQMVEVSSVEVDDTEFMPLEMYVDADQLVIIGNVYHDRYYGEPYPMMMEGDARMSIYPGPYFDQTRTKVYLYDISNRSNPTKQRSIEIEGNYSSSRKVGKNVYFVLNQSIPYYDIQAEESANILLPRFKDSAEGDVEKPLVRCMGVQYFPYFQNRNYLIVAGLNIADLSSDISRRVLLGSSQNIFSSQENLYVASPQYKEVRKRDGNDIYFETEQTTIVYRFELNAAVAEYQNQATVPGTILNQFSMDEMGDTFRIATERSMYNSTTNITSDNNLYVLDNATMSVTGKVEGIAPNEHIKSVRFIGNRAYMVTFLTVDPLFVIDLTDKTNPKIVGTLKIPGWSDYLHPYDETHLIGFGRDVDPSIDADLVHDQYSVYYTALLGMKLSLFDVSDVTNPKEMFNEIIGTRGTTSELLTNHKALLFDRAKNLLAFPITITEAGSKDASGAPQDINTVFSGGIVYSLDLVNGFQLKGKVTHYENDDVFANSGEYFYGEPGRTIQRMLYIGEYLYSVSPDFVRSYILSTVAPVAFIQLKPNQTEGVDYIPTPPPGGMTQ